MPRRKKSTAAESDLSISWVKEVTKVGRFRKNLKYAPLVDKLFENPDKIAHLAEGLTSGQTTARISSLRAAVSRKKEAEEFPGVFKFPMRRTNVDDETYTLFGIYLPKGE